MIRGSASFAMTNEVAVPAKPELDLDRWPSWIRDALAIRPETRAPARPSVAIEPTGVDPASTRKLTRVPVHS
jgi:hypothetical protein